MAGRIEDIRQCPASGAITLTHHLQHLDGGNQRGGGEVLERSVVGDVDGLDIEALALHHPEQLLDRPALAKKWVICFAPTRVATGCGVNNRQCAGVPPGGSTSRASTKDR